MQLRTFLRAALVTGVAGSALGATACSDPFQPTAQLDTFADTLIVFAFSASSAQLPSAIDLSAARSVPVGTRTDVNTGGVPITTPTFDIAVDINAGGQVVLYPSTTLLSSSVSTPRIGFRTVTTAFDSLRRAPTGGFRFDSAFVVTTGQTVAIESQSSGCTSTAPLRAKLVVDSVSRSANVAYVRVLTNPNCGFRSLLPGRPTS